MEDTAKLSQHPKTDARICTKRAFEQCVSAAKLMVPKWKHCSSRRFCQVMLIERLKRYA